MKKLLSLSLFGYFLLFSTNSLKADDYDAFAVSYSGDSSVGNWIWGLNSQEGTKTLISTKLFHNNAWSPTSSYMNSKTGELIIDSAGDYLHAYNFKSDTWRDIKKDSFNFQKYFQKPTSFGVDDSGDTIQIGKDTNDVDITPEGLSIDGDPLISKKANGELHIGKNSLITKEEDGVQKLYAKDENGNAIDINVTNGSKLLIDGVEVKAGNNAQITTNKNNISTNKTNIKKLGEGVAGSTALTAALTALPQTSKESKLSCGVGTGAYSSRYALGFGCASKINERVDINAGGSYVFGGSKSYGEGTLDSGVIKAGFVFKLGELNKPTLISMHEKEKMEDKIFSLEEKNEKIISQNEDLKNKNQSIIAQNKSLLARLERLEKLALIETKSKDLATIKLP